MLLCREGHGNNGPVGDHVCGVDFAAEETEYWSPCSRLQSSVGSSVPNKA